MANTIDKWAAIATIKQRIRKRVFGDASRPRLSVYRSEKHIYGQIIDDMQGRTLFAASTRSKDLQAQVKDLPPSEAAKLVGEALAQKAVAGGVSQVVFDRNGRRYGGRLQAFADGARGKGLLF
jgi:large subunit ribosomal protein L18